MTKRKYPKIEIQTIVGGIVNAHEELEDIIITKKSIHPRNSKTAGIQEALNSGADFIILDSPRH